MMGLDFINANCYTKVWDAPSQQRQTLQEYKGSMLPNLGIRAGAMLRLHPSACHYHSIYHIRIWPSCG